jgi:hypothetical protein
MLLLGGVILLGASLGLSVFAGATVRSFEILGWRIGEPPPGSLDQLDYVAGLAGLFALGWIVAGAGISSPGPGNTITPVGRVLYAAAGLLTIVCATLLAIGIVTMERTFMILATSESTPKYDVVERAISHCSWHPFVAFGLLALAALCVAFAGPAGLRKASTHIDQSPTTVRSMIMIGVTAFFAVLFAALFILVSRHGAALESLATDNMPKPSELAGHLQGILNNSLGAYLILLLLGILQIVAAVLAPATSGNRKQDASA